MRSLLFILAFFTLKTLLAAPVTTKPQEKLAMCAACHGEQGVSVNPQWPNLAGQHARYLNKQLHDYKEGKTRPATVMTPLVAQLSEEDIQLISEFYEHLPRYKQPLKKAPTRGEILYRSGDAVAHITACIACHGPDGHGNAEAGFPLLAGQQVAYTLQQLQAFKDKRRVNDLNSIMRDISSHMSNADMKAVARYIHRL
jgi:cytochrome c553